jgi:serine phosphatase RsbU (regulator of sigma subunit)
MPKTSKPKNDKAIDESIYSDIELNRAWMTEYARLGNQYAQLAAWLIIFTYPFGIIADIQFIPEHKLYTYLLIQLFPSFVILLTLIIRRFYYFEHEYLVLMMAFSIFTSATHRVEGQSIIYYIINNGLCFVGSASLMIVRRLYPIIIVIFVILVNILVQIFIYQEDLIKYLSRDGGLVILVLGLVFLFVANFRYQILRSNFINSLRLTQSYRLLESKSRQIEEQNEIIQQKNEDITASINYAERIQKAILPSLDYIRTLLPECFIFFKPRDIVSGDFYWFGKVKESIVITAVDCTGHGVPGALMSMIGNQLLNQIILEKEISKADVVLNELQIELRRSLKRQGANIQDGMDIALLIIHPSEKKMEYSGAKNPLVYIQNQELNIIKADLFSIGSNSQDEAEYTFQGHTIDISIPTTCYLYSDGFQDQFGGSKGKKFMTTQFRELLHTIHQESIENQEKILENTLNHWMQPNYRQVDDVLVIGLNLAQFAQSNTNQLN